jgi:hypothetical protein
MTSYTETGKGSEPLSQGLIKTHTPVIMFMMVLVPCSFVGRCQRSGETHSLHLWGEVTKLGSWEVEGLYMARGSGLIRSVSTESSSWLGRGGGWVGTRVRRKRRNRQNDMKYV